MLSILIFSELFIVQTLKIQMLGHVQRTNDNREPLECALGKFW